MPRLKGLSISRILSESRRNHFKAFSRLDKKPEEREDVGIQGVFNSVFPIKDFRGNASLEFVGYKLEEPRYDYDECLQKGITFAAPLKVTIRLVVWDKDEETGVRSIRDVKEQEVYFGDFPLMTDKGTFVINGTERVIVSQLHRSPGVFFEYDKNKGVVDGRPQYSARIIPNRGSWLDLEFDHKGIMYVRIDRRRKVAVYCSSESAWIFQKRVVELLLCK